MNAHVLNAVALGSSHQTGQRAALAVILGGTTQIGAAMDVGTDAVQTGTAAPDTVIADDTTGAVSDIAVEGGTNDAVGGECRGLEAAVGIRLSGQVAVGIHMTCLDLLTVSQTLFLLIVNAVKAVGTVFVVAFGLVDGLDQRRVMVTRADQRSGFSQVS